jgi:UDP-N-acetylmuramyl pentapeptide phosphotransferase/UDP-N-acetylglucosamine-1-phosphate transferase
MTLATILALLIVMLASATLCALLIVVLKPLLQRYALARPNARSSHQVPTPQGAGLAVIAATLLVAGAAALFATIFDPLKMTLVFGAALLVGVVGAIDDLRPLPVAPRLALQAVAVALAIYAAGGTTSLFPLLPFWLEKGLLLLAGVWFVNLVNFMDGIDWITAAEVVPVSATLVLLGLIGGLPLLPVLIATALCGATIGFAPFNRPVAKVFLGDVGSLPIGLLLGWCLLELATRGHVVPALLLPLYYLCDATLTLARRALKREPVWQAHRTHFYQRATDNGFSVMAIVTRIFALNVLLAAMALLSAAAGSGLVDALCLIAGLCAVALVLLIFSRPRSLSAN